MARGGSRRSERKGGTRRGGLFGWFGTTPADGTPAAGTPADGTPAAGTPILAYAEGVAKEAFDKTQNTTSSLWSSAYSYLPSVPYFSTTKVETPPGGTPPGGTPLGGTSQGGSRRRRKSRKSRLRKRR